MVRPLRQEWNFVQDFNGLYGTRVYLDCADEHPEAVDLPILWDGWDEDNATCTLKKIDIRFLCDRGNDVKRYTLNYDSYVNPEPEYNDIGSNENLLPTNIDIAAEWTVYQNPSTPDVTISPGEMWSWKSSPTVQATDVTIIKSTPVETFVITRYGWGADLHEYNEKAKLCVGKVNKTEFLKFDPETVRFDGANLEEIKNNSRHTRKWLARLKFSAKLGLNDTWNKTWNFKTNTYEELIHGGDVEKKLHDKEELTQLFRFGQGGISANPVFPNQ